MNLLKSTIFPLSLDDKSPKERKREMKIVQKNLKNVIKKKRFKQTIDLLLSYHLFFFIKKTTRIHSYHHDSISILT